MSSKRKCAYIEYGEYDWDADGRAIPFGSGIKKITYREAVHCLKDSFPLCLQYYQLRRGKKVKAKDLRLYKACLRHKIGELRNGRRDFFIEGKVVYIAGIPNKLRKPWKLNCCLARHSTAHPERKMAKESICSDYAYGYFPQRGFVEWDTGRKRK